MREYTFEGIRELLKTVEERIEATKIKLSERKGQFFPPAMHGARHWFSTEGLIETLEIRVNEYRQLRRELRNEAYTVDAKQNEKVTAVFMSFIEELAKDGKE